MSIKSSASALGFVAAVMVMLTGCGDTTQKEQSPAKVTAIAGSSVQQVQLTERAVQRLGIATKPLQVTTVKLAGHADARKVIPYSAVVYDTDGSTWTYVNTAARTYLRQPIRIGAIQGSTAVLLAGPAAGAAVVTVGVPELLGTEYNISGEQ